MTAITARVRAVVQLRAHAPPTVSSSPSREQLLGRHEPHVREAGGIVEQSASARRASADRSPSSAWRRRSRRRRARASSKPRDQLLERRARNQAVATELCMMPVSQHERIDEPIVFAAPGRATELANPPVVHSPCAPPTAASRGGTTGTIRAGSGRAALTAARPRFDSALCGGTKMRILVPEQGLEVREPVRARDARDRAPPETHSRSDSPDAYSRAARW